MMPKTKLKNKKQFSELCKFILMYLSFMNWVRHGSCMCFIVPCLSQIEFSTAVARRLKQALVVHCSIILLGPHTVLSTLPDDVGEPGFGPYLPVSRLEYEIFWIIAERLPFLVDFQIFCIV